MTELQRVGFGIDEVDAAPCGHVGYVDRRKPIAQTEGVGTYLRDGRGDADGFKTGAAAERRAAYSRDFFGDHVFACKIDRGKVESRRVGVEYPAVFDDSALAWISHGYAVAEWVGEIVGVGASDESRAA